MKKKYLLIGAGLFNSVIARNLLDSGNEVTVIEKNNFLGGQCADYYNEEAKCWVNFFGCHIFHFDNKSLEAKDFILKYGDFKPYTHKVCCIANGKCIYWPLNNSSSNLYDFVSDEKDAKGAYAEFVESYSKKMWGEYWEEISHKVLNRFNTKQTIGNSFFGDENAYILQSGFTNLFHRLFSGANIIFDSPVISTNIKFIEQFDKIIVTSPIDEFFNYKFGKLDWVGIDFESKIIESTGDLLPSPVVNLNTNKEILRVVEYNQFSKEQSQFKLLVKEKPSRRRNFYPIDNARNFKILQEYQEYAKQFPNLIFAGRLGTYKYLDMDETIQNALNLSKEVLNGKNNN